MPRFTFVLASLIYTVLELGAFPCAFLTPLVCHVAARPTVSKYSIYCCVLRAISTRIPIVWMEFCLLSLPEKHADYRDGMLYLTSHLSSPHPTVTLKQTDDGT